jgi:hypothetical protein
LGVGDDDDGKIGKHSGLGRLGKLLAKVAGLKVSMDARGYCDQEECEVDCCEETVPWYRRQCHLGAQMTLGVTGKNPGIYFGAQGTIRLTVDQDAEWGGCPYRENKRMCFNMTGEIQGKICGGQSDAINGCIIFKLSCNTSSCVTGSIDIGAAGGSCRVSINASGCIGGWWCSEYKVYESDEFAIW